MDAVYAVNSGARPALPRQWWPPAPLAAPCAPYAAEGPERATFLAVDLIWGSENQASELQSHIIQVGTRAQHMRTTGTCAMRAYHRPAHCQDWGAISRPGPGACQRWRACIWPKAAAAPVPDQDAPGEHARRLVHRPAGRARERRAPERARACTRAQACSLSCRAAGSSRWPRTGATAWRPTRPSWPPWACRTPTPSSPRSCRSPTCPRRVHAEALPVLGAPMQKPYLSPGARAAGPAGARAQPLQARLPTAAAPVQLSAPAGGRRPCCSADGACPLERAAATPPRPAGLPASAARRPTGARLRAPGGGGAARVPAVHLWRVRRPHVREPPRHAVFHILISLPMIARARLHLVSPAHACSQADQTGSQRLS